MKKCLKLVLWTGLFWLLATPLTFGEKTTKSPWKVEDVILQEGASEFDISPDGAWAVWVKTVADKEKDTRVRHIFLTSLEKDGETVQLTRGDESEFSPRWSPSGKWISFLSPRAAKEKKEKNDSSGAQLWLLDRRGGEPWRATDLAFGITASDWIDDGLLLLLAREAPSWRELEQKEKKDTASVVEDQDHMPPQRLFVIDVKQKKITRLTQNDDQITSFALSHDKKWVLTRNNQSVRYEIDKKIKPKFFLIGREDGSSRELFTDPNFKPTAFFWSGDDKGFYFSVTRTSDHVNEGPGADFLYYFDLETKAYREVPLDWEWGLFYLGFEVRPDGFVVSLANGARPKWRRYYKNGDSYTYKELEGKHYPQVYSLVLQKNGSRALYSYTTASLPLQWYSGTLEENILQPERKITSLNSHLDKKVLAKSEVIRWKGALDEEIEGILFYPHAYKPGARHPLVVMIHGGPTGVDMDAYDESYGYYPNLMAQRGAFVFQPNYHGSGGYGQKFAESIKGHYYEYELPDILKGIDALVEKGLVDPDRVATLGWSNGGILSMGLTTWTNRFKAAGIGAADVDWVSDYGNCAFGVSFDNYYFRGAPWDEVEHYIQKSPLFHLKEMKVPTIIFHGTEDTNVPYNQGWEYYRALQQIGQAPVKFIIFPGEPHGLRKLTHQQRKMEEELAWFDRYFFKSESGLTEALKKGSPLDLALKMRAVSREGRFYGKKFKGSLIPEVVNIEDFSVGRFEVTRAQWAAFDKKYSYEPGTENYPASGMTIAQARLYVRWLRELTGQNYRLPKISEAEQLAKLAGKSEITLDYWAGYTLNPEDTRLLMTKIKEVKGFAPLLLPVDRSLSREDEMVFGLGGNAAEWAEDEKGGGKAVGPNAVTPLDPHSAWSPPALEYTGLRIILDEKDGPSVIK
jgi:dipeptidyl aminopeptidase/acylaminoacyl peptidase